MGKIERFVFRKAWNSCFLPIISAHLPPQHVTIDGDTQEKRREEKEQMKLS